MGYPIAMDTALLNWIRILFIVAISSILIGLFTIGVSFRTEELAFLNSIGRTVSTAGYRAQYALTGPRDTASVILALAPQAPSLRDGAPVAHAVPVLLYHGIVASSDRFSLTQETFRDQMFALKRAGYQTITLQDFLAFEKGEKDLPEKSFLLTFDDGRTDSYERGDPVLQALGYTAVMYVATEDSLDAPQHHSGYYLTSDEIRRMQASGRWEIGSHARQVGGGFVTLDTMGTRANFLSNRQWLTDAGRLETTEEYTARVDDELGTAQRLLTSALGVPIISLSYPFGDYGQEAQNQPSAKSIINEVARRYYAFAFEQVWPGDSRYSANYSGEDPYYLRRIEAGTTWSGAQLLSVMNAAIARPLPYTETFESVQAWKHNWGIITMHNGMLTLDAAPHSTGAFTFLDGAGYWGDYRYTVAAQIKGGTTLGLIARYQDEGTMLSCTFSDGVVRLKQQMGSSTQVLAEKLSAVPSEAQLGMGVIGSDASCSVDGTSIVDGSFDAQVARGGIGLTIWDETAGSASATISSLEVTTP